MAAVSTPPDDDDLPFTPADSDKATPTQLDAIQKSLCDLKAVETQKSKELGDYIRSGHTTSGFTTHGAAVHVLKSIREVLGEPAALAA